MWIAKCALRLNMPLRRTAPHPPHQECIGEHGTARQGMARHSTAQHSTARRGTERRGGTEWHTTGWRSPLSAGSILFQNSLGYIMTKSASEVRADLHKEEAEHAEKSRQKMTAYKSQLLAAPERMVELCDCPYGSAHDPLRSDATGRVLRRGCHLARGSGASGLHGIYYGGGGDLDVIFPAPVSTVAPALELESVGAKYDPSPSQVARDGTPSSRRSAQLGVDSYSKWLVSGYCIGPHSNHIVIT